MPLPPSLAQSHVTDPPTLPLALPQVRGDGKQLTASVVSVRGVCVCVCVCVYVCASNVRYTSHSINYIVHTEG